MWATTTLPLACPFTLGEGSDLGFGLSSGSFAPSSLNPLTQLLQALLKQTGIVLKLADSGILSNGQEMDVIWEVDEALSDTCIKSSST